MAKYIIMPTISGFNDTTLPTNSMFISSGIDIGFNSASRRFYVGAIDGYYVKMAYLKPDSDSYYTLIAASLTRGAGLRVGGTMSTSDGSFFKGWIVADNTYTGTDKIYYAYNIGQTAVNYLNSSIPIYYGANFAEARSSALAIMDDGIWSPQPSTLITRLSINLDYPNAGQPLAQSATATVEVEDVETSVTSITWEPNDTEAEQLTEYKATVTISADGGRFNSGIEPVVVDTGDTSTTYVQGVSRPVFDPENPSVITYTISFGPTGIKDPYEVDRDEESEAVEDPDAPSLSGVSTHFISLYEPSESQIRSLASYMWTDDFIENLKKVVNDPFQTILGLSILPVTAPTSGSGSVILGNVDTGISMPKVSSQYVKLNCGTVTVEERYRSYLDYNPYTKIWLYLPYIGIQSIDTDSIMGTSLSVSYTVDVLNGACIANVISNGSIIGSYAGMCASQLPVTAGQYGSMVSGIFQAVGGIAQAIAGAGTGNYAAAIAGGVNAVQGATTAAKVTVDKSGKLGSTSGLMGVQYPFLIIERPRQAQPTSQNHYTGYPSFMTLTVGNLKGYSEIANIDLSGISATQKERDELLSLLNTGVYF